LKQKDVRKIIRSENQKRKLESSSMTPEDRGAERR
jgi:hypothetical protein